MLLLEYVALSPCSTEHLRILKCNLDSSRKPLRPVPTNNKPHSQTVYAGVVIAWCLRRWRSNQVSVDELIKFLSKGIKKNPDGFLLSRSPLRKEYLMKYSLPVIRQVMEIQTMGGRGRSCAACKVRMRSCSLI